MSVSFKEAFKSILEIEKIKNDEKISFSDAIFSFLEKKLLLFALELNDQEFFLEISKITRFKKKFG